MWQSHLDRFSLAKVQISVIPAQAGIHLLLPHCNDLLQNVTSKHLGLSRMVKAQNSCPPALGAMRNTIFGKAHSCAQGLTSAGSRRGWSSLG